jgi:hypothetical protein
VADQFEDLVTESVTGKGVGNGREVEGFLLVFLGFHDVEINYRLQVIGSK